MAGDDGDTLISSRKAGQRARLDAESAKSCGAMLESDQRQSISAQTSVQPWKG